jgi:hypothetical protein
MTAPKYQYTDIGALPMELELSEEQIKSFAGQGLKLVVLIVAIYGFWTFLLSPLLDSLEQQAPAGS